MRLSLLGQGTIALSQAGGDDLLLNLDADIAGWLQADAGWAHRASHSLLLSDARPDNVNGLLALCAGPPLHLYLTPNVFELLSQDLSVLPLLQLRRRVQWHVIAVAGEHRAARFRVDCLPGLEFTALATESLDRTCDAGHLLPSTTGLSIALAVRDPVTGQRLFSASAGQQLGSAELDWIRDADCVLVGEPTAWADEPARRSWRARHRYVHGRPGQREQRASTDGFEPACDGMVIEL